MQLDAPGPNAPAPETDAPKSELQAALEALRRLPSAAAPAPPAALVIELPEGDSIDCYELAKRIAEVVEMPSSEADTIGRTRRAINPNTDRALWTLQDKESNTEPDRETPAAVDCGAPRSQENDAGPVRMSPLEDRRLTERVRRMQDFQRRVNRGVLSVFTRAHDASVAVSDSTYMTRSAAEQYLRSCGFQVRDRSAGVQADLTSSPTRAETEITPEVEPREASAAALSEVEPVVVPPKPHAEDSEPTTTTEQISPQASVAVKGKAQAKSSRVARKAQAHQPSEGSRFLRIEEVVTRIGLGRTSVYNRINPLHPDFDPTFPQRIPLGRRAVGFRESDLEQWIAQQQPKK